ncbi:MAG: hypothetical protein AAFY77_08320 [Pseudomonadota bacterium]
MERMFEAAKLDVATLPDGLTHLSVYTIRKADLRRLSGIDRFPLQSLSLRWLSAPDLTQVPLAETLTTLSLSQSPKLRSLAGLERAPKLTSLFLEDNGCLEDAGALHSLPDLTALTILGGTDGGQKIETLEFLDGLNLTTLSLRAVQGADLDLGPVARMRSLTEIDIHGPNFRPEELAKVAAAHPAFHEQLMTLEDYPADMGMRCKKCGGVQKQLFLRKVKGLWCPVCDAAGLAKQLEGFEAMVAAVRLDNPGSAA